MLCVYACEGQKRVLHPLELEEQEVVSGLMQALGTQLGPSTLNC